MQNSFHIKSISCLYPVQKEEVNLLTPDKILLAICRQTGITPEALKSNNRAQRLADIRHIVFSLILKYCPGYSLKDIGAVMNRHHTSVLHAKGKVQDMCETDSKFRIYFIELEKKIEMMKRRLHDA